MTKHRTRMRGLALFLSMIMLFGSVLPSYAQTVDNPVQSTGIEETTEADVSTADAAEPAVGDGEDTKTAEAQDAAPAAEEADSEPAGEGDTAAGEEAAAKENNVASTEEEAAEALSASEENTDEVGVEEETGEAVEEEAAEASEDEDGAAPTKIKIDLNTNQATVGSFSSAAPNGVFTVDSYYGDIWNENAAESVDKDALAKELITALENAMVVNSGLTDVFTGGSIYSNYNLDLGNRLNPDTVTASALSSWANKGTVTVYGKFIPSTSFKDHIKVTVTGPDGNYLATTHENTSTGNITVSASGERFTVGVQLLGTTMPSGFGWSIGVQNNAGLEKLGTNVANSNVTVRSGQGTIEDNRVYTTAASQELVGFVAGNALHVAVDLAFDNDHAPVGVEKDSTQIITVSDPEAITVIAGAKVDVTKSLAIDKFENLHASVAGPLTFSDSTDDLKLENNSETADKKKVMTYTLADMYDIDGTIADLEMISGAKIPDLYKQTISVSTTAIAANSVAKEVCETTVMNGGQSLAKSLENEDLNGLTDSTFAGITWKTAYARAEAKSFGIALKGLGDAQSDGSYLDADKLYFGMNSTDGVPVTLNLAKLDGGDATPGWETNKTGVTGLEWKISSKVADTTVGTDPIAFYAATGKTSGITTVSNLFSGNTVPTIYLHAVSSSSAKYYTVYVTLTDTNTSSAIVNAQPVTIRVGAAKESESGLKQFSVTMGSTAIENESTQEITRTNAVASTRSLTIGLDADLASAGTQSTNFTVKALEGVAASSLVTVAQAARGAVEGSVNGNAAGLTGGYKYTVSASETALNLTLNITNAADSYPQDVTISIEDSTTGGAKYDPLTFTIRVYQTYAFIITLDPEATSKYGVTWNEGYSGEINLAIPVGSDLKTYLSSVNWDTYFTTPDSTSLDLNNSTATPSTYQKNNAGADYTVKPNTPVSEDGTITLKFGRAEAYAPSITSLKVEQGGEVLSSDLNNGSTIPLTRYNTNSANDLAQYLPTANGDYEAKLTFTVENAMEGDYVSLELTESASSSTEYQAYVLDSVDASKTSAPYTEVESSQTNTVSLVNIPVKSITNGIGSATVYIRATGTQTIATTGTDSVAGKSVFRAAAVSTAKGAADTVLTNNTAEKYFNVSIAQKYGVAMLMSGDLTEDSAAKFDTTNFNQGLSSVFTPQNRIQWFDSTETLSKMSETLLALNTDKGFYSLKESVKNSKSIALSYLGNITSGKLADSNIKAGAAATKMSGATLISTLAAQANRDFLYILPLAAERKAEITFKISPEIEGVVLDGSGTNIIKLNKSGTAVGSYSETVAHYDSDSNAETTTDAEGVAIVGSLFKSALENADTSVILLPTFHSTGAATAWAPFYYTTTDADGAMYDAEGNGIFTEIIPGSSEVTSEKMTVWVTAKTTFTYAEPANPQATAYTKVSAHVADMISENEQNKTWDYADRWAGTVLTVLYGQEIGSDAVWDVERINTTSNGRVSDGGWWVTVGGTPTEELTAAQIVDEDFITPTASTTNVTHKWVYKLKLVPTFATGMDSATPAQLYEDTSLETEVEVGTQTPAQATKANIRSALYALLKNPAVVGTTSTKAFTPVVYVDKDHVGGSTNAAYKLDPTSADGDGANVLDNYTIPSTASSDVLEFYVTWEDVSESAHVITLGVDGDSAENLTEELSGVTASYVSSKTTQDSIDVDVKIRRAAGGQNLFSGTQSGVVISFTGATAKMKTGTGTAQSLTSGNTYSMTDSQATISLTPDGSNSQMTLTVAYNGVSTTKKINVAKKYKATLTLTSNVATGSPAYVSAPYVNATGDMTYVSEFSWYMDVDSDTTLDSVMSQLTTAAKAGQLFTVADTSKYEFASITVDTSGYTYNNAAGYPVTIASGSSAVTAAQLNVSPVSTLAKMTKNLTFTATYRKKQVKHTYVFKNEGIVGHVVGGTKGTDEYEIPGDSTSAVVWEATNKLYAPVVDASDYDAAEFPIIGTTSKAINIDGTVWKARFYKEDGTLITDSEGNAIVRDSSNRTTTYNAADATTKYLLLSEYGITESSTIQIEIFTEATLRNATTAGSENFTNYDPAEIQYVSGTPSETQAKNSIIIPWGAKVTSNSAFVSTPSMKTAAETAGLVFAGWRWNDPGAKDTLGGTLRAADANAVWDLDEYTVNEEYVKSALILTESWFVPAAVSKNVVVGVSNATGVNADASKATFKTELKASGDTYVIPGVYFQWGAASPVLLNSSGTELNDGDLDDVNGYMYLDIVPVTKKKYVFKGWSNTGSSVSIAGFTGISQSDTKVITSIPMYAVYEVNKDENDIANIKVSILNTAGWTGYNAEYDSNIANVYSNKVKVVDVGNLNLTSAGQYSDMLGSYGVASTMLNSVTLGHFFTIPATTTLVKWRVVSAPSATANPEHPVHYQVGDYITGTDRIYGDMVLEPVLVQSELTVKFDAGDIGWKYTTPTTLYGTSDDTAYVLDSDGIITFTVDSSTGITERNLTSLKSFLNTVNTTTADADGRYWDFYGFGYDTKDSTGATVRHYISPKKTKTGETYAEGLGLGKTNDYFAQGEFASGTVFTAEKYVTKMGVKFTPGTGYWTANPITGTSLWNSSAWTGTAPNYTSGLETNKVGVGDYKGGIISNISYTGASDAVGQYKGTVSATIAFTNFFEGSADANTTQYAPDDIYADFDLSDFGTATSWKTASTALAGTLSNSGVVFLGWKYTRDGASEYIDAAETGDTAMEFHPNSSTTITADWGAGFADVTWDWGKFGTAASGNAGKDIYTYAKELETKGTLSIPAELKPTSTELGAADDAADNHLVHVASNTYQVGQPITKPALESVGAWKVTWYKDADNDDTMDSGEAWDFTTALSDVDITLKAWWTTDIPLNILDGGISGQAPDKLTYEAPYGVAITLNTLLKDGNVSTKNKLWSFDGWYMTDEAGKEGAKIANLTPTTTDVKLNGVSLAAKYDIRMTLSLDADFANFAITGTPGDVDADGTTTAVTTLKNTRNLKAAYNTNVAAITAASETLSAYEGYIQYLAAKDSVSTFLGWYTDEARSEGHEFVKGTNYFGENGITTLYAKFEDNSNLVIATLTVDSNLALKSGNPSETINLYVDETADLKAAWPTIVKYVSETPVTEGYELYSLEYSYRKIGETTATTGTYTIDDYKAGTGNGVSFAEIAGNADTGRKALTLKAIGQRSSKVEVTLIAGDEGATAVKPVTLTLVDGSLTIKDAWASLVAGVTLKDSTYSVEKFVYGTMEYTSDSTVDISTIMSSENKLTLTVYTDSSTVTVNVGNGVGSTVPATLPVVNGKVTVSNAVLDKAVGDKVSQFVDGKFYDGTWTLDGTALTEQSFEVDKLPTTLAPVYGNASVSISLYTSEGDEFADGETLNIADGESSVALEYIASVTPVSAAKLITTTGESSSSGVSVSDDEGLITFTSAGNKKIKFTSSYSTFSSEITKSVEVTKNGSSGSTDPDAPEEPEEKKSLTIVVNDYDAAATVKDAKNELKAAAESWDITDTSKVEWAPKAYAKAGSNIAENVKISKYKDNAATVDFEVRLPGTVTTIDADGKEKETEVMLQETVAVSFVTITYTLKPVEKDGLYNAKDYLVYEGVVDETDETKKVEDKLFLGLVPHYVKPVEASISDAVTAKYGVEGEPITAMNATGSTLASGLTKVTDAKYFDSASQKVFKFAADEKGIKVTIDKSKLTAAPNAAKVQKVTATITTGCVVSKATTNITIALAEKSGFGNLKVIPKGYTVTDTDLGEAVNEEVTFVGYEGMSASYTNMISKLDEFKFTFDFTLKGAEPSNGLVLTFKSSNASAAKVGRVTAPTAKDGVYHFEVPVTATKPGQSLIQITANDDAKTDMWFMVNVLSQSVSLTEGGVGSKAVKTVNYEVKSNADNRYIRVYLTPSTTGTLGDMTITEAEVTGDIVKYEDGKTSYVATAEMTGRDGSLFLNIPIKALDSSDKGTKTLTIKPTKAVWGDDVEVDLAAKAKNKFYTTGTANEALELKVALKDTKFNTKAAIAYAPLAAMSEPVIGVKLTSAMDIYSVSLPNEGKTTDSNITLTIAPGRKSIDATQGTDAGSYGYVDESGTSLGFASAGKTKYVAVTIHGLDTETKTLTIAEAAAKINELFGNGGLKLNVTYDKVDGATFNEEETVSWDVVGDTMKVKALTTLPTFTTNLKTATFNSTLIPEGDSGSTYISVAFGNTANEKKGFANVNPDGESVLGLSEEALKAGYTAAEYYDENSGRFAEDEIKITAADLVSAPNSIKNAVTFSGGGYREMPVPITLAKSDKQLALAANVKNVTLNKNFAADAQRVYFNVGGMSLTEAMWLDLKTKSITVGDKIKNYVDASFDTNHSNAMMIKFKNGAALSGIDKNLSDTITIPAPTGAKTGDLKLKVTISKDELAKAYTWKKTGKLDVYQKFSAEDVYYNIYSGLLNDTNSIYFAATPKSISTGTYISYVRFVDESNDSNFGIVKWGDGFRVYIKDTASDLRLKQSYNLAVTYTLSNYDETEYETKSVVVEIPGYKADDTPANKLKACRAVQSALTGIKLTQAATNLTLHAGSTSAKASTALTLGAADNYTGHAITIYVKGVRNKYEVLAPVLSYQNAYNSRISEAVCDGASFKLTGAAAVYPDYYESSESAFAFTFEQQRVLPKGNYNVRFYLYPQGCANDTAAKVVNYKISVK